MVANTQLILLQVECKGLLKGRYLWQELFPYITSAAPYPTSPLGSQRGIMAQEATYDVYSRRDERLWCPCLSRTERGWAYIPAQYEAGSPSSSPRRMNSKKCFRNKSSSSNWLFIIPRNCNPPCPSYCHLLWLKHPGSWAFPPCCVSCLGSGCFLWIQSKVTINQLSIIRGQYCPRHMSPDHAAFDSLAA